MFETIICEYCGYEQQYDPDNDVLLCDKCDHLIFVPLPPDDLDNSEKKDNHAND